MRLQAAHRQIPIASVLDRIEYARTHDGHLQSNPTDFQIMSGNMCNLACKMCGPRYSNTWSKFFRRRGFDTLSQIKFSRAGGAFANADDSAIYLAGDQDWPITNPLSTVLPEYYADIRHIFLTGGEPTLIVQNIEFLEQLVSTGHSRHIELRFSTNLTNINQRLLNVLDHFGKIGINMSLDGMDDIAYIQRTPSDWTQILKNTDYLMSWLVEYQQRKNKFANITVNTVVSALNIHHVLDLWCFLAERYTMNFHMGFTALVDPFDNYYIGQVPRAVVDQILAQLPDATDEICRHSPSMRSSMENFEFHLRQDIYSDDLQDIQHLLNGIQGLHPELDIQEIYRIYYPDAV
jgi:pyruvate-formate lyase-activating enzyme